MKAIAVFPGKPNSVHLADLPRPSLDEVPNGRGVLVRVLRVGVDGTDREINAAEYGAPPPGSPFLVLGHEGFGRVEAVGPRVTELRPGDLVVATVRRPGKSLYDVIGTQDMTTDDTYYERGISLLHGFLTEHYVDDADHIVKVPAGAADVGVLLEPLTVVEKAIAQAYEVQRRLKVWRPRRAAVVGTGTIGLLGALVLRLRGLDVVAFGKTPRPYRNAELLDTIGAHYVTTSELSVTGAARELGAFDLVLEGSGFSPLVFDAMGALAKNGVLVLTSVTGGDHRVEIPADRLNLDFVLGNRVMVGSVNAGREHFEAGVRDLAHAQSAWPGWLAGLLTHPVKGLERYDELFAKLHSPNGAIKIFCEVAPL
ncbi:MAG TPA: glucose 1-dehydrogenase [Anaeromyxobacteraceae bacterium]|nr:glucose 1-dehydrogenase [Anaeromyxobacteraceae bacterium]